MTRVIIATSPITHMHAFTARRRGNKAVDLVLELKSVGVVETSAVALTVESPELADAIASMINTLYRDLKPKTT